MQKLDRTGIIVIILCVASFIVWQRYMAKHQPPPQPVPSAEVRNADEKSSPTPSAESRTQDDLQASLPLVASQPGDAPVESKTETFKTQYAEYDFSSNLGGLDQVLLLSHHGEEDQTITLNAHRNLPIGALGFLNGEILSGFAMESPTEGQTVFSLRTPDQLEVVKRFTLPEGKGENYLLTLEIFFHNAGDQEISRPDWMVTLGSAVPIHLRDLPMYTRFEWGREGKMRTTDVNWFSAASIPILGIPWKQARSVYEEKTDKIAWAGVTSQYFCTLVSDPSKAATFVTAQRFDWKKVDEKTLFGMEGSMGFPGFKLAPGASHSVKLHIYAGPKDYKLLKELGGGQEQAMNFGIFKPVSIFLLWLMNKLHSILGNYAWSIIIMTLLIKGALWPIQNKATQSMKKMSVLSPKMTEMRAKYKDDPQKMNQEMMKLYREYGVNPFSGCLPMLIQIPIFFGFYSMLGSAIELRNSSFLWIHDLSQPDTVFHLGGIPINILPILMAGTMIWQMVISPKSGDAMQQRMMIFMPVIFLVFAYNYASALSLYWTTQNLFSIVQLYLTRDKPMPKLEKRSDVLRRAAAQAKKQKRSKRRPS